MLTSSFQRFIVEMETFMLPGIHTASLVRNLNDIARYERLDTVAEAVVDPRGNAAAETPVTPGAPVGPTPVRDATH